MELPEGYASSVGEREVAFQVVSVSALRLLELFFNARTC